MRFYDSSLLNAKWPAGLGETSVPTGVARRKKITYVTVSLFPLEDSKYDTRSKITNAGEVLADYHRFPNDSCYESCDRTQRFYSNR